MRAIFLVGYMGSGKSTFGRKLAERLGLGFIDTDIYLENRYRERVVDMFASKGEELFRRRERMIAEEVSGIEDVVIATGGGLPCHFDTMELLLSSGLVVYLEATDDVLASRLELCKRTRPTIRHLSGEALSSYVREVMAGRRPIYERAHERLCVDAVRDDREETALAQTLAHRIRQLGTW